jgi:hypothetical protein
LGGLAAVAAAAGVLGACGSATPTSASPEQAQQAVTNAFRSLGSQSGVVLHISLGVTGAELQQLAGKDGSSRLTAKAASDLAATSIVVDLNTGNGQALNKQTSTDPDEQFGLAVNVATAKTTSAASPVQLRYVNQTFYVRADLPTLLKDLDQSPSAASGFQKAVASPEANNYVHGLATLGQGGWVSVPASTLTELLQALGGGGSSSTSMSAQQLWLQLENAFNANAVYAPAGASGGRTHYTAMLKLKPFIEDMEGLLPASLGSIPGASSVGKQINSAVGQIGNQKVVADVWVSGDKVQEIDVNLRQFDHQSGFAVPVRIQISSAATVQPPPTSTPLDLSNVGGLLGGMLSGGSST